MTPDPPMFPAIFLDNHDSPRFLSVVQSDLVRLRSALVLLLFTRGVPLVYYGTEQVQWGVEGTGSVEGCRLSFECIHFHYAVSQPSWGPFGQFSK